MKKKSKAEQKPRQTDIKKCRSITELHLTNHLLNYKQHSNRQPPALQIMDAKEMEQKWEKAISQDKMGIISNNTKEEPLQMEIKQQET